MSRWATSLIRRWRPLRSSSIASSGPRPWDANSPDPYGSVRAREGRTSSNLTHEPITLIAGAEIVARAIDRIPRHRGRLHPSDRGILGPRRREWTAPRAWGHLDLSHEHKPRDGTLLGRARRPDGDRARSDRGGRADVRCLCDVRQWERKRHRDIPDPVRIHAGLGRMDRQRPRNTRRTRTEDAFFRHRSRGERNHPHEPDPIALCAQRPDHNVVSTQWRPWQFPLTVGATASLSTRMNFSEDFRLVYYGVSMTPTHVAGLAWSNMTYDIQAAVGIDTPAGHFEAYPIRETYADGSFTVSFFAPVSGNHAR